MGSKMHHSDQVLLVNDFVSELQEDYQNLTIKEFELIIKNGIRKKYDTEKVSTVGLTIVNFNFWYKRYSEERAKMDIEISNKLTRERSNSTQPRPVKLNDVINLIKDYHLRSIENYNYHSETEELNCTSDEYWLNTGLHLSANYIFDQLIKFNEIKLEDLEKQIEKIKPLDLSQKSKEFKSISDYKPSTKEYEAKRYLCCKYYLENYKSAK
jgi:hypothetical protein